MSDPETEIREATANAVQHAAQVLRERNPQTRFFGFALCTDDDVRTLYHVACTVNWVREKEVSYPDIGFIYVEWTDSTADEPFNTISRQLASLADQTHYSDEDWAAARDGRFDALVLALLDCRNSGTFDERTLLCVGSTDPSEHLELLAMHAVDKLNSPEVADEFARALGVRAAPRIMSHIGWHTGFQRGELLARRMLGHRDPHPPNAVRFMAGRFIRIGADRTDKMQGDRISWFPLET